jgi:hypothetical protein
MVRRRNKKGGGLRLLLDPVESHVQAKPWIRLEPQNRRQRGIEADVHHVFFIPDKSISSTIPFSD